MISHKETKPEIKTWTDLYDTLQDCQGVLDLYIIIDEIMDINSFLFCKKSISKVFALANSFSKLKLILVSNFDMKNSELRSYFDFSSFIGICFPLRTFEDNKKIIDAKLESISNGGPIYEDIVKKSLVNLEYPIMNLNEIYYCIKESVENFNQTKSDEQLQTFSQDFNRMSIQVKPPDFNTRLTEAIRKQIQFTPTHIKSLNENMDDDKDKKEFSILYSNKNLTESLSRSQKILLLSSFLANETTPNNDEKVFLNTKKSFKSSKTKKGLSLKTNAANPFPISRLLAIYFSLKNVIEGEQPNQVIDVELICDVGTLTSLDLLRCIRNTDNSSFMSRKLLCGIGLDFAINICEDFDIQLTDFVHYEN